MNSKILTIFIFVCGPMIALAESYKLAYSINDDLCSTFKLKLESNSTEKRVNFLHWKKIPNKNVNKRIKWDDFYCYFYETSEADINNDHKSEYLLRNTGCLSGIQSHNLYIYSEDIKNKRDFFDATNKLAKIELTGSFYSLTELPKIELKGQFSGKSVYPAIGGMFNIEPFTYKEDTFISLNTKGKSSHKEDTWHIVTKYNPSNALQDQCYFKVSQ